MYFELFFAGLVCFLWTFWAQFYNRLYKNASETVANTDAINNFENTVHSGSFDSKIKMSIIDYDIISKLEPLSIVTVSTETEKFQTFPETQNISSAEAAENSAENSEQYLSEAIEPEPAANMEEEWRYAVLERDDSAYEPRQSSAAQVADSEPVVESHQASSSEPELPMATNEALEEENTVAPPLDVVPEPSQPAQIADNSSETRRTKIVKEILSTEITYVGVLQKIVNNFKLPLQNKVGTENECISMDEIKAIFSDVEIILAYNKRLLEELNPRIDSWSNDTCIGDILVKFIKFLKVYTSYIQNYEKADASLVNCRKRVKFAKCLEKLERENGGIDIMLIVPVQRIPRYKMLFEDLAKHTPENHPDKIALVNASQAMKEVAIYVNEKKREFESIDKVNELQNLFGGKVGSLITPSRRFIRSDLVGLWNNNHKAEQLNVSLFNDLIVVSTPNKTGETLKETIYVGNVKIKEPKLKKWAIKRAALNMSKTSGSESIKTVELINSDGETILKVVFDSAESRAKWANEFNKTREELDQIEAKKTERAKLAAEEIKSSITSNFLKLAKRANLNASLIGPDSQEKS